MTADHISSQHSRDREVRQGRQRLALILATAANAPAWAQTNHNCASGIDALTVGAPARRKLGGRCVVAAAGKEVALGPHRDRSRRHRCGSGADRRGGGHRHVSYAIKPAEFVDTVDRTGEERTSCPLIC
jgi:hypothetical protein